VNKLKKLDEILSAEFADAIMPEASSPLTQIYNNEKGPTETTPLPMIYSNNEIATQIMRPTPFGSK
jgi:hypothetical protein